MPEAISAHIGAAHYRTDIKINQHQLIADEPLDNGGADLGPGPSQYLLAALAACTAATLRMYADRKGWGLESVELSLTLEVEKTESGQITHIQRNIQLKGNLSDEERRRLMDIADKCPVHRILSNPVDIVTKEI